MSSSQVTYEQPSSLPAVYDHALCTFKLVCLSLLFRLLVALTDEKSTVTLRHPEIAWLSIKCYTLRS